MDITYRPAKQEDLEEAERVVQQSGNALLVRHGGQPWPAPPSTAFRNSAWRKIPPGSGSRKTATPSLASASAG
jgi:hypothetical protein